MGNRSAICNSRFDVLEEASGLISTKERSYFTLDTGMAKVPMVDEQHAEKVAPSGEAH